jgi:hypothetical protein
MQNNKITKFIISHFLSIYSEWQKSFISVLLNILVVVVVVVVQSAAISGRETIGEMKISSLMHSFKLKPQRHDGRNGK